MSGLYVYALTGAPVVAFPEGGSDLESIDLGGFFAVATAMAERPAVSEEALRRQHEVIVNIAARTDAVLPARFASLLERDELRRLADLRREVIRDALDLVRGREQMTVRLMGAAPQPVPVGQSAPASTGTAYLRERRAAASGRGLPGVEAIERAVRDLVAAARVEPGPALTSVYHLIWKADRARYRGRIDETAALAAIEVRVSGPWPPFAFTPELFA